MAEVGQLRLQQSIGRRQGRPRWGGMGEYAQGPGPERATKVDAKSTRDREKITADAGMEAGRIQRVGGKGVLPLETARSLDEEEESQESDFEATLFVFPDGDTDLAAARFLWTEKEIDWFIDAEESLEAPFEPDDLLWLVKQMALELEATEWMAMDEEEVLQFINTEENIEPPFEPDGEAWLVKLLSGNLRVEVIEKMVEVEAEVRENVASLLASDDQITDKINAESDRIGA
ncbi:hypothetical protein B0H14DRAFT_3739041 [Mycena olivaceomarginata]|nr:hypothetical protein B0H14DRAFT_3739041 [Mycena olivaceomarginata]